MRAILRKHIVQAMLAGAACTLPGYVMRTAAGAAVGLGDAGRARALLRSNVLVLPMTEEEHITTFVLHKHQRFGITGPLQRFLAHISTLS